MAKQETGYDNVAELVREDTRLFFEMLERISKKSQKTMFSPDGRILEIEEPKFYNPFRGS